MGNAVNPYAGLDGYQGRNDSYLNPAVPPLWESV